MIESLLGKVTARLRPKGAAAAAPGKKPPAAKKEAPKAAPQTVASRRSMTMRPPSFTDMLPYLRYSEDDQVFLMRDGTTVGAMLELLPISTEAKSAEYMQEHAQKVQEVLQSIPEEEPSPWVVQFFLNDDMNVIKLKSRLEQYIGEVHKAYPERARAILESDFTQTVLAEFNRHIDRASRPEGLFFDSLVTGQPWRVQLRRVRCCIYKRFGAMDMDEMQSAQEYVNSVVKTLTAALNEAGVQCWRANGRDFYEWLMPFFNPDPVWAENTMDALQKMPYEDGKRGEGEAPIFGFDIADSLLAAQPRSDVQAGLFEFDGRPCKALVLQSLQRNPEIGHFSAERKEQEHSFARFDRLPSGCMLSVTTVVQSQHRISENVERIRDASRAGNPLAQRTHRECDEVLDHMSSGDKLFPTFVVLYVTAKDRTELEDALSRATTSLVSTGLRLITPKQDLVPLDAFMRGLPFNYDHAFDTRSLRRQRLTFASQIARMLPVYGRARGTNHPGMWFWNRGGEPLLFDPLSKKDRKKNAHMLVFGPTGAGKSATLNYLAMLAMAVHKPRLVIVDAGRSFELLLKFFQEKGLSTYHVDLTADADVSLPPFVHAMELLNDPDIMTSFLAAESHAQAAAGGVADEDIIGKLAGSIQDDEEPGPAGAQTAAPDDEEDDDEEESSKRDLLGEMLITAIMMITGGERREVERLGRADRYLITTAIIRAAARCRDENRPHPLTHDVAIQLMEMIHDEAMSTTRRARAEEMGQAMMAFTQGLRGRIFNRLGSDWPDVDVTLVEMGTLTQDGYEDAMAVAYTNLIDAVQSRAERHQSEDRPIICLTDEGHLVTTNELLGPKIAKGTKMWRKLNAWFWLATQNLHDFPASMSRVLSMCEYWMLLTMDRSEIDEVAKFRTLTAEQKLMVESARKEPPKYTEGVVISALGQMLFRNIPPSLPIALAMTEGHEKSHRRRLMDEHGCTELEAAFMVARELEKARE